MKPDLHGQLVYKNGGKNIQEYTTGEETASSINGVGKIGQLHG